jgi:hypothetical protein
VAVRRRGAALCLAALTLAVGCSGPESREAVARAPLQRLLSRQAEAVLDRDRGAYLDTVDPRASGYRTAQRAVFGNLRRLPIAEWSYRVTGIERRAAGSGRRVTVRAELNYRLRGYDRGPVTEEERLELAEHGGRWYVLAEREDSTRQLWEQGEITVLRGEHSLVLGVGREPDTLRALADNADRAVPAVDRVWPGEWPGRVVVVAPATVAEMAELLSAPSAGYRGIAAVTTGGSGDGEEAPTSRITVNPEAYGLLSEAGQRMVMTHETTHAATRGDTTGSTPLWLSEGFADWAGYHGTGRTVRRAAPELLRAVAAGDLPERLPDDGDFAFSRSAGQLARSYEAGWLACRMVAVDWGEDKLTELYRAAGHGVPGGPDAVLREVLGVGEREFTARWRSYVRRQLG